MSEPDRARRIHVEVRLAELRAKHGPPPEEDLPTADLDPSWGPVGSLAQRALPTPAYEHLVALHESMLALERSRKSVEAERDQPMPIPTQHAPDPEPQATQLNVT